MFPFQPLIDHVVINVEQDLDAAAETYTRLGFRLTERGHHTLGTSNHLAIFGTDYLELLGHEPGRTVTRPELLGHPRGLTALVFKPPAIADLAKGLQQAGIPADAPRSFSRPVQIDGKSLDASFNTLHLHDAVPNGRVFFCEHLTPELVWRPEWQRHPNGVTGIAELVFATATPVALARKFTAIFPPDHVSLGPDTAEISAGSARIRFLTHDKAATRFGSALPPGQDRFVALGLRTTSLDVASESLRAGGIAGVLAYKERLLVPASSAAGVALEFTV